MTADTRELDDLQVAARDVFADLASSLHVHRVVDGAPGRDTTLDAQLAELGFYSVLLPGEDGTLAHLLRIVTEAGAATATTRLLGHAVGLGSAAALAPASARREELLVQLSAGAVGTVVGVGRDRPTHRKVEGGWELDGSESFVLDADGADLLVVWSDGDDGPLVAVVAASVADLTTLRTIDRTRVLSTVDLTEVRITEADVLASGSDAEALRVSVALALDLALAYDSVGVARRALDLTVDYAKTRVQFGQPIGSFQAVKHQAADMVTRTELARATCDAALRELDDGASSAAVSVALAREVSAVNAAWVAGRAMQLHGGIGYTWEHDVPILLKRAKLNEKLVSGTGERRAVVLADLRAARTVTVTTEGGVA